MQFVLIIQCAIQNIGIGFVYIVASYFLFGKIAKFCNLYIFMNQIVLLAFQFHAQF